MQKLLTALTGVNLILCIFLLTSAATAGAGRDATLLRGRALEIVDGKGRVRAAIGILPQTQSTSETVILRLINADGQPSTKIATSADGAGISLVGGDDLSYITLTARDQRRGSKWSSGVGVCSRSGRRTARLSNS